MNRWNFQRTQARANRQLIAQVDKDAVDLLIGTDLLNFRPSPIHDCFWIPAGIKKSDLM